MALKKVLQISPAVRDDIADLTTRRALPTQYVTHVDPFLFLNHHGPQVYPPHNQGLPFGPHPHRGFETVTFILTGELSHEDSGGHQSIIYSGGVQWMTAGSGLVHSEISSKEFKEHGGPLEILQLWVNLPAKLKMTKPKYLGLQQQQIPTLQDGINVSIQLVSGGWKGQQGPFPSLTDIHLMILNMKTDSKINFSISEDQNIFFYVVRGRVSVNQHTAEAFHLVQFEGAGEDLSIQASDEAIILFGHAKPYREPVVSHGPFVMNTREEILEAIQDYQNGKFNKGSQS